MSFLLIDNIFKFFKTINNNDNELVSSLYSDNFHCFCKQNIELDESQLREHIQQCKLYQKESPFYKEFLSLPLKLFKKVHLMALKSEFQNFIDMIDEQLVKSNKLTQKFREQRKPKHQSTKIIWVAFTINCTKLSILKQNNINEKQQKVLSLFKRQSDRLEDEQQNCPYCLQTQEDSCINNECQMKLKISCKMVLECGHKCCGFIEEPCCPPCMKCNMEIDLQDLCGVCYIETLQQAPCIITSCGHVFHYSCLMKCLQFKWSTPEITFNFCMCALCKSWLEFHPASEPQQIIDGFIRLKQQIQYQALKHLKQESEEEIDLCIETVLYQVINPGEFALSQYCYYQCCRCQLPYFGGTKDCQRMADSSQLKAQDLVCPECAHSERCPKHGTDFIVYKCRYCCNPSLYFCWGTTHFCEQCHQKQCNGEYLNKKPKDQLPQCLGTCGGQHRPNGEEQALGCSLCKQ